jgi:hypothetical protein
VELQNLPIEPYYYLAAYDMILGQTHLCHAKTESKPSDLEGRAQSDETVLKLNPAALVFIYLL